MHSLRKSCCSGVSIDERRAPRSNPAFRKTSRDCFVAIASRNDEFDQQNCPTGQISKNLSSRKVDDEKASRLISEIPKFRLPTNPNHFYILTVLSHRGACARHERGAGCGGRGSARDERGLLAYGE